MAFEYREYPEWSWSQTRDTIFQECQRKYYYQYYASHNGWLRDSPEEAKSAYRLKQLANLYILFGDALHQLLERVLKESLKLNKLTVNVSILEQQLRNYLNRAFTDSRNMSQWLQAPKKSMMLHEMYYEGRLPQNRVIKVNERIKQCVENLRNCRSLQDLLLKDNRIVEVEQLNTFQVEDTPVFVKLDVLYHLQSEDRWVIVDWKTGLEDEENEEQLLLYALFLNNKYQVPIDKAEIRLEYLLTGQYKSYQVDGSKVDRVTERVKQSVSQMQLLLEDAKRNKPYPQDRFPTSPAKMKCRGCNFRDLCTDKLV
ncbi:PD-(D/E)XK nuclease family protein [Paenibacillus thalictri]|uniref:Dna2/Cas4 domain-containing protein n=1 Tax=Paenibacillus thalictri TaxID=2527873 RepID=A0A4Q9DY89_9BACL|nr:PD-(D/E)XK nuclease family protein [Paenibacillus thalictri]TBL80863.1 Dna2/Cas4 domain-containing protein [Paenibacillus thalictri]